MKKLVSLLSALMLGAIVFATDADAAKRLGGGRSVGTQRNVTAPPAATPAKPAQAQQQAAPAQQGSKWGMLGGILGGLALGGLLAWALSGTGLSTILLVALLAIVAFMAFRAFGRRRAEPVPENVQFAGMSGSERVTLPERTASIGALHATSTVPAVFDAATFLRAAKLNFVKLQIANDSGKLDEIREFTTGEMFDELRKDVTARSEMQATDVMSLNADLLEVATEQENHWASVRFSGMVREAPRAEPEAFTEVWNLVKPADGSTGWLLAGIQQMH